MRALWVACLLFGSISCVPVRKDYGSNSGSNYALYPGYYGGNRQAFDQSQPQPGSYYSKLSQYGPSSGYSSDSSANAGYASNDAAPDESNVGYGGPHPAPVFSDVSDLEPVYSFSSRSRYLRGRAVYAESRYTPGEQGYPFMPAPRYISGSASQGGNAADAAKGTY
ncbi:uncharacterized protein V6R79_016241 [Siganus canaliculatus]